VKITNRKHRVKNTSNSQKN